MSEVNKTGSTPLKLATLRERYRSGLGSPGGVQQNGIEIETWLMQPPAGNSPLRMMSPAQSQRVLESLATLNPGSSKAWELNGSRIRQPVGNSPLVCVDSGRLNYQLELCGVIETATAPLPVSNLKETLQLIDLAQAQVKVAASLNGLRVYNGAVPGSFTVADCAANQVNRERLRSEWEKFSAEGATSPGLRTMGLAASTQYNISYRTPREAGEIMALGYMLSPVLYALFANSTGFVENKPGLAVPRAAWWLAHNKTAPRGGLPLVESVFSRAYTTLTDKWIDYVRDVPMVYYIDEKNQPRFDSSPTFNELAKRRLGTAANYALAESLVWPDVKLIAGQRLELRMPDTGPWQPQGLAILGRRLFGDEAARQQLLKELPRRFGLDAAGLMRSRIDVAAEGLGARYGNGLVRGVLPVIKEYLPENIMPAEMMRALAGGETATTRRFRDGPRCPRKADLKML